MVSSNNQIEEIKDRIDIVSVVEKYLKLRQSGKNYIGLCPFHTEKTPSFIVSPDIQRYKCFGCGESGDIFNFVQKIENLDFPETLEKLAKEAGIELQQKQQNPKYKLLEEINYEATKYFYNELKKDKKAMEYVKGRGFTEESIKTFGIGYAPRYPNLKEALDKRRKYPNDILNDSGLFHRLSHRPIERFFDRIMFPIRSKGGKVIGFTARKLPPQEKGPKYLNSPDTPLFHKNVSGYGLFESKQEIRKQDLAIICEGSTDVISAHQHGIKNIVAPLGTALTEQQLISVSTLTKNILFFFDSDEAGQKALIRGFELASKLGLNPYAATPHPYKDIDELLQKEPKLMQRRIKNKAEAFSFIITQFIEDKDLSKLESLNKTRKLVESLLESVTDNMARQHYLDKARSITKIDLAQEKIDRVATKGTKDKGSKQDTTLEQKYILLLLFTFPEKHGFFVDAESIQNEFLKNIYNLIQKGQEKTKEELFESIREDENLREDFEELIFHLVDIPSEKDDIIKELELVHKRIRENELRRRQKDLSVKIASAEENNKRKELEKYMKELMDINKILNEIK